ncbi:D-alanine--D-alanine ligase [bacterium SCSIO 12741]|nr:D-alanine--D-alanine ligase [bacterium SCSIO 12741]
MSKLNIAVICGGYSGEYDISMKSAATIMENLDPAKYEIFQVILETSGWKVSDSLGQECSIVRADFSCDRQGENLKFDAVINAVHGTPGEDGLIQGYFDMLGIPYNSCDVLISSLTFNKGFCNQYLKQTGIRVADSVLLLDPEERSVDEILEVTGLPCFVKPNDGGSSIGVSKVKHKEEMLPAIHKAFEAGNRVLIERFVQGTEVTCGVIRKDGKVTPLAVTEIVFASEFFDYEAKYNSADTQEITPARISDDLYAKCMKISAEIFERLNCKGFFRADFIIQDGEFFLIEVNTVPGMSKMSLMPQMIEHAGLSLGTILDEQISEMVSGKKMAVN